MTRQIFIWNFGLSAAEQFGPVNVAQLHSFTRNKYDFVDRENEIVLACRNVIDESMFPLTFVGLPDKLAVGNPITIPKAAF